MAWYKSSITSSWASLKGFGFVVIEGEDADVYIDEKEDGGALDGDKVEIVIIREPKERRREGKVVRIVYEQKFGLSFFCSTYCRFIF